MRRRRNYRAVPTRRPYARLWVMILVLVVLAFYLPRARNPRTWSWLAPERRDRPNPEAVAQEVTVTEQPTGAETDMEQSLAAVQNTGAETDVEQTQAAVQDTAAATQAAVVATSSQVARSQAAGVKSPLDQDPKEREKFARQSEVIVDRSLKMSELEMAPYWRLVRWAQASSFADLEKRADRGLIFNDFVGHGDKHRGKLVRIKINAYSIKECKKVAGQPADTPQLYEIWGPSEQSLTWPYMVVTHELPPGVKPGELNREPLIVCGYYFKLQGYHNKGGAKDVYAPLLIGRVARAKSLPPPPVTSRPMWWLFGAGAAATAALGMVWMVMRIRAPRRRKAVPNSPWRDDEQEPSWSLSADGTVNYDTTSEWGGDHGETEFDDEIKSDSDMEWKEKGRPAAPGEG